MTVRAVLLLCAPALIASACAPEIRISTSKNVASEPVIACVPSGGAQAAPIDTACAEGSPRCYKIRPLPGDMESAGDDFGLSVAAGLGGERGEVFCFTSTRPAGPGMREGAQNIWVATRSREGRFTPPVALTMNEGAVMEGAPSLTPDGQWLYFAAKNRPDSVGDCDIYAARLVWRNGAPRLESPGPVPNVNSKYFDSHPSISPDGTTLYFSSDRPGGMGNSDIWYSIREKSGGWSTPKNLGPPVNTSCSEMTPFICGDGQTLYFASDGFNSAGGFDLFTTSRSDAGAWSMPANLGAPVNTQSDELFPSTPPTARADSVLAFSSNRPGGAGGYDLYRISPNPMPPFLITLRGTVRSLRTKEPVPEARLFWKDRTADKLIATMQTDARGEFFVTLTKGHAYEVGAQAEHYFFDTYALEAPRSPGVREFAHDFFLAETLALRINFPFNEFSNPYPTVLDDAGNPTHTTWEQSLEFVALNLTSFREHLERVTLTGHTDSVGTEEYNLSLSEKRAAFVRDKLVSEYGIPRELIEVVGKGKSELLPRRPGESDESYGARCRRVELSKVIRKGGGQ